MVRVVFAEDYVGDDPWADRLIRVAAGGATYVSDQKWCELAGSGIASASNVTEALTDEVVGDTDGEADGVALEDPFWSFADTYVTVTCDGAATGNVTLTLETTADGETWFAVPFHEPAVSETAFVSSKVLTASGTVRLQSPGHLGALRLHVLNEQDEDVTVTAFHATA